MKQLTYKGVTYNILEVKHGRYYLEDEDGNKKDLAQSTIEKEAVFSEDDHEEKPSKLPKVEKKTEAQKEKERNDYLNEKVSFMAMRDDDKYVDDITVTVNGKNFVIKRGVQVSLPRYVFNILEAQQRQIIQATNTSDRYIDKSK